ncbi:MAG: 4-demethylwyosine synthase TYW1 [Candidatus Heimdallarchaeum aukensis]|uniref:S-adenosyl-L-methionine-dependent tRNA 4-demethylwyosine synthase n=1 Tax=Candidatus Heimdallarchaeum aukensis TaxID=2876573 RepID=A0A9Y1BL96_9ARCH|nr:MAG: 4-demethylwyosine synthase TYW1 [Candidatus Heimdallarchaeum aukensis]
MSLNTNIIPPKLKDKLEKQQYRIAGNHSAVKICTWLKHALKGEGFCYKQQFYGIASHRCLQCTPATIWCNLKCVFCWRSASWYNKELMRGKVDKPEYIIDQMIEHQRRLIAGFKNHPKVEPRLYEEAYNPKHAAISLSGEPTFYPLLPELIQEFHNRDMTTFLVTNGTNPEMLKKLDPLPTQLYVTLIAPTEESFKKTARPSFSNLWNKVMETIELLPSLNTRKVIRLTLVDENYNLVEPEAFAELFLRSEAHFLEVKGFMSVGDARKRLPYEIMPRYPKILEFSKKIIENTELKIIDSKEDSAVTLIAKEDYNWRKNLGE